jgi:hypothetical protein
MNGRVIGLVALALVLVIAVGTAFALIASPAKISTSPSTNTPTATAIAIATAEDTSLVVLADIPTPYPALAPPSPVTTSTNGYTLTLYPVSADPSRVLITYTLTAPPGHNAAAVYFASDMTENWELNGPMLRESDGTQLSARPISARSDAWDEHLGYVAEPTPSASTTKGLAFDTTHLPNTSSVLSLHLIGDLIAVKSVTYTNLFMNPITETIAPNLSFDFTLPVSHFRRVTAVNQTSSAGGLTLTLDRVTVSASETVLFMHGSKDITNFFQGSLLPRDLQVRTHTSQGGPKAGDYPLGSFSLQNTSENEWVMFYPSSLLQSDNQWTVSIQKVSVAPPAPTDIDEEHEGPWIFHFTLAEPTSDDHPLALP